MLAHVAHGDDDLGDNVLVMYRTVLLCSSVWFAEEGDVGLWLHGVKLGTKSCSMICKAHAVKL